jgi:hypothetical protein
MSSNHGGRVVSRFSQRLAVGIKIFGLARSTPFVDATPPVRSVVLLRLPAAFKPGNAEQEGPSNTVGPLPSTQVAGPNPLADIGRSNSHASCRPASQTLAAQTGETRRRSCSCGLAIDLSRRSTPCCHRRASRESKRPQRTSPPRT